MSRVATLGARSVSGSSLRLYVNLGASTDLRARPGGSGESSIGLVTAIPGQIWRRGRASGVTDLDILTRGAEEVLPEGQLAKQLASGDPLRVKLGIDPTAPDIHLGHVVVLDEARAVPAGGAPGRADHRRLHGPGRRPERALCAAPDA